MGFEGIVVYCSGLFVTGVIELDEGVLERFFERSSLEFASWGLGETVVAEYRALFRS